VGRTWAAGLPVGVQLAAGPFQDERLLALATAFEQALEG
jgi:Asp-tRNA(Asn)/Glu-tRNA(Gln) amidotransferase A subunit family amidase